MIHATSVVKKIHFTSTSMVVAKKKRLQQLFREIVDEENQYDPQEMILTHYDCLSMYNVHMPLAASQLSSW